MVERRDYQFLRCNDLGTLRGQQGKPGTASQWQKIDKEGASECPLFQFLLLVKVVE
jgi:hypothetical protein